VLAADSRQPKVQVIPQANEFDALRCEFGQRVDQVLQGPRKAIDLPDQGRKLGRPRVTVDASQIASLRALGRSWAQIKEEVGISKRTAQRALIGLPKIG
jgi:hypothetical protein